MKRLFIAGFAATALSIGAASAADMPVKATPMMPAPVAVPTWTGFYVGGNGGGAWSKDSYSFNNGALTVESFNFNPSSYIAGGQVGYQWQGPTNWVIGLEGTWSWTNLNQTDSSAILTNINGPSQRSLKVDQIATVSAKLGYAWNNMLWYGKIGYAGAEGKFSSNDLVGITSSATKWGNGVNVGAGIDYRLYNNFIVGAEFDYYYVNFTNVGAATSPAGFNVSYNSASTSIFAVVGRVSYLFNWGG
jgi:outer membrane immunogenic protein